MPRGNAPRQPSRSGRQEGGHQPTRAPLKKMKAPVNASTKSPQPRRTTPNKASKPAAKKTKSPSGYNPVAPERVRQIIAGLDEMYPAVTCALRHRSAWELLVATILSAQSTDVRVNK